MMTVMQANTSQQSDQLPLDALAESSVLPGVAEAELPFALPFNVPREIMEKLQSR
ncbi:hypothetical protein KIH87_18785 [Paraneptunicella aestuarii]|uniref:hypothetical protein n=1 Tax=Paraneptunicella aestuarii TaxID=2831148 RepID=UPI001E5F8B8D|nr:hypothetical protein [Paraneptunicella aestuarii]UAA38680.1 hypothetical protein KIH87_18785 [Paraneptunicella aestuarii]